MLRALFPRDHRRYEQSCCGPELNDFAGWLTASGYSRQAIRGHLCRLRGALERSGAAGAGTDYSEDCLGELFRFRDVSARRAAKVLATQRAYRRFLLLQGRLDAEPQSGPHGPLIEEYGQFLREVRGFAQSTIAQHRFTVIEFLTGTVEPTQPVSTLSVTHVERYLSRKAAEVTRQTLQHTVAHLRAFLRYSFERGLIHERLDTIDTPRAYRGERPPRAMPWPLVLQLLTSIDRTSRAGWRDYAILHLMAHYGLRPSEIVALAVESVDFDDRTLRVEQRKTSSDLLLPLAAPTLRVLHHYLEYERAECAHSQLFLRARSPSGALRHTAVCDLFTKRARESGLPLKGLSSYSLRHAFAMRLLERGVGVKAIGDLLGHRSLESTCVYLRLDMPALRTVALPVPGCDAGRR